MEAPVAGQQDDDHVHRAEGCDQERGSAYVVAAEIQDRPIGGSVRVARQPSTLQQNPGRNEKQTEKKDGRYCDEDHQAHVRVLKQSRENRDHQRNEQHR
jgi:hypothetical protein